MYIYEHNGFDAVHFSGDSRVLYRVAHTRRNVGNCAGAVCIARIVKGYGVAPAPIRKLRGD